MIKQNLFSLYLPVNQLFDSVYALSGRIFEKKSRIISWVQSNLADSPSSVANTGIQSNKCFINMFRYYLRNTTQLKRGLRFLDNYEMLRPSVLREG